MTDAKRLKVDDGTIKSFDSTSDGAGREEGSLIFVFI